MIDPAFQELAASIERLTARHRQQQAEAGRRRKLAAQTARGSGTRALSQPVPLSPWARIVRAGGSRLSTTR